jgi:hypothetical protein
VEEVLEETSEMSASLLITVRARFPYRRLDVVLDHAPWHYGAAVVRIARLSHLPLHYLPASSPAVNLLAPLWEWVREEPTSNYESASVALN